MRVTGTRCSPVLVMTNGAVSLSLVHSPGPDRVKVTSAMKEIEPDMNDAHREADRAIQMMAIPIPQFCGIHKLEDSTTQ